MTLCEVTEEVGEKYARGGSCCHVYVSTQGEIIQDDIRTMKRFP